MNLVQQLDGASGHHAAQAHDKAGREGTHGEERKLLHTHTQNAHNAQFSHGELHTVQHTNLNEQKDRQVDKVSAIYIPTPTLRVGGGGGVLGGGAGRTTITTTITIYFIHPSGKLKLSFNRTMKNISR